MYYLIGSCRTGRRGGRLYFRETGAHEFDDALDASAAMCPASEVTNAFSPVMSVSSAYSPVAPAERGDVIIEAAV